MYAGDWLLRLSRVARQARPAAGWRVPANVWGLGITSLLTDVSSEMVVSILPAYLVLTTGFAPLLLGVATGLHEGGPLLVTWIGGWIAGTPTLPGFRCSTPARRSRFSCLRCPPDPSRISWAGAVCSSSRTPRCCSRT